MSPQILGSVDIVEGFLAGKAEAVSFIEGVVARGLAARSLNLGEARADVQQETLRRLVRSLGDGQFRGDAALTTYVHKVAHRAAIDHWRSVRRRREEQGSDHPQILSRSTPATQGSALEREDQRRLVGRLLARLALPCRNLLTRVYFEETSYAAIASASGKTEGAIKVQVHRCRQEAGRLLNEMTPSESSVTIQVRPTPNGSTAQDLS